MAAGGDECECGAAAAGKECGAAAAGKSESRSTHNGVSGHPARINEIFSNSAGTATSETLCQ